MKIAIIGAGKLGIRIVDALLAGDYDITLVDTNEEKLVTIAQQFDVYTVTGDGKTVDTLKEIDIRSFDLMFSCTTSDDTNILCASLAKALGCKKVIARIREPEHMNQIDILKEHFNIDTIVNPDHLITSEIYRYLIEKYTLSNGIYTTDSIGLIEFEASKMPRIIDKNLIEFREMMPLMLMVGISRNGKLIIPHGSDVIKKNDIIYLMGTKEDVVDLNKKLHIKRHHSKTRRVMIVGGGKTGFYLAKRLSEYGASVKLIEQDKKRCHYLTNHLRNVMVLHGDGANMSLLLQEDMEQMDAFVTCTGFDEENILLALTAKAHGIEDVISKVSHDSYDELISTLDIDMVLNPLDLTATAILRNIRGNKRVISSVLLQGQAELMEVVASEGMSMINIPLSELKLPSYIIIAAIRRGLRTIIPNGNTRIKAGDRVIIVCQVHSIGYVEKLFKPNVKLNILK